jgi:hypothetical protein
LERSSDRGLREENSGGIRINCVSYSRNMAVFSDQNFHEVFSLLFCEQETKAFLYFHVLQSVYDAS